MIGHISLISSWRQSDDGGVSLFSLNLFILFHVPPLLPYRTVTVLGICVACGLRLYLKIAVIGAMRPRLFSRGFLAKPPYCLHVGYSTTRPLTSGRLSITASSNTPRSKVIRELARYVGRSPINPRSSGVDTNGYGAAILASRDFTNWLNDENFMSSVLETLFKSENDGQASTQQIDTLTGVVDAIGANDLRGEPRAGLSILYGLTEDILPNLWDSESLQQTTGESGSASIKFATNPLEDDVRSLELTLPLANTVFQNGRQSTLCASRWESSPQGPITLKAINHKSIQSIFACGDPANHTSSHVPLLPVTPPRKIIAGLGNIVRQVEVDGSTTPASRELELLIPKILDIRSKRHAAGSSSPVGVWCWVIPAHVVEAKKLVDIQVLSIESMQSEAEVADEAMKIYSGLLSAGCRLHKILSGGGGWGLKQGLLSLDPETHHSLPGEDDIEMFIKSFQERNKADSSEGIVTPGSYIMFCIEPQWTEEDAVARQSSSSTQTLSLGVAPHSDFVPSLGASTDEVAVIGGHFGATSAAGLFLRTIPELSDIDMRDGTAKSLQPFTTKVDVPRACFWTGGV
ncbi:hypothetical protein F4775DRAFT_565496 [Biscogniauxia sp. FL1348]|nr:hypothetical protein F4775DRAFT_565496 [Biscogniauxia sp. FL1348]